MLTRQNKSVGSSPVSACQAEGLAGEEILLLPDLKLDLAVCHPHSRSQLQFVCQAPAVYCLPLPVYRGYFGQRSEQM